MKKETPKQLVKRLTYLLQDSKKRCGKMYLNEPTRIYAVGARIQYGNWEWSHILESFDNGKFYKVLNITPEIAYGNYIGQKFEIAYLSWVNFLPYRVTMEGNSLIQNKDLELSFSQRDISGMLHMYYTSGLDLNPDYQRGNVWAESDKVDLIDSIFKNIDIGKFTVIRRSFDIDYELYEMLDGKQRVNALIEFYEDRFTYKGLKYSELKRRDQSHFKYYNIAFAQSEPMKQNQKYRYFLNLNVTGKPVDPDHIKHVEELLDKGWKANGWK